MKVPVLEILIFRKHVEKRLEKLGMPLKISLRLDLEIFGDAQL